VGSGRRGRGASWRQQALLLKDILLSPTGCGGGGTRSEAEYLEANVSGTQPFPPYSLSRGGIVAPIRVSITRMRCAQRDNGRGRPCHVLGVSSCLNEEARGRRVSSGIEPAPSTSSP